jgi:nitrite reductase/ring-hydroxylating ferredoxin subunit
MRQITISMACACFDLRTGEALTPPVIEPVQAFAVVVQDDDIYVDAG